MTAAHVGFESWLERDHLMLMDFDLDVVAVSSQPFWLRWSDGAGRSRRQAPDFFARQADDTAVVVDVRPDDRVPAKDAEAFAVTAQACGAADWDYRRAGDLDPVLIANVRWLSRYRHRRCLVPEVAAVLLEAFADGRGLFEGAGLAGGPAAGPAGAVPPDVVPATVRSGGGVIVECDTEQQQIRLLETLAAEGHDVGAIMS
jgi:hypothetical protein